MLYRAKGLERYRMVHPGLNKKEIAFIKCIITLYYSHGLRWTDFGESSVRVRRLIRGKNVLTRERITMRLILDDQNDPNAIGPLLEELQSFGITTLGAATIGSRAVILTEARHIVRAAKILEQMGIRARIE